LYEFFLISELKRFYFLLFRELQGGGAIVRLAYIVRPVSEKKLIASIATGSAAHILYISPHIIARRKLIRAAIMCADRVLPKILAAAQGLPCSVWICAASSMSMTGISSLM